MAAQILQVNFRLTVAVEEYERIAESFAQTFAQLPGLSWKIWLLNEETGEAGGHYLFESEQALQAFLEGPIPPQLESAPFLRDLSVRTFSPMEAISARTRAPLGLSATVPLPRG